MSIGLRGTEDYLMGALLSYRTQASSHLIFNVEVEAIHNSKEDTEEHTACPVKLSSP